MIAAEMELEMGGNLMVRLRPVAVILLVFGMGLESQGQTVTHSWVDLKLGSNLLVTTIDGDRFSGQLLTVNDQELLLWNAKWGRKALSRTTICRVVARRSSSGRQAVWSVALGAVGAVVGLLGGFLLVNDTNGPLSVMPIIGVATGASVGALIGRPLERVVLDLGTCP